METFTIGQDHLKLLKRLHVRDNGGRPEIDSKRPYGNSCIAGDIAEILEWNTDDDGYLSDFQEEGAFKLHSEMATVIQIGFTLGGFEVGAYRKTNKYDVLSWVKI